MVATVVACSVVGCSSMYFPQTPGHVGVMLQDGKPVYVRDGRVYQDGVLGGGLVDAVQGNPTAERAAVEYHGRKTTGLTVLLLGLAAEIGGLSYGLAAGPQADGTFNDRNFATGISIALAGMVASLIGAGYMASAEPYRWDAINLFNDGAGPGMPPVQQRPMYLPQQPPQRPYAAPPGGVDSLHMR